METPAEWRTDSALDHDVYPYSPGRRNIDTSIDAAEAMAPKLGRLQALVLAAITAAGERGLTAHELSDRLHIDRVAIQPRTSELRRLGKIDDSGQRRRNGSGRRAIVWTTTGACQ